MHQTFTSSSHDRFTMALEYNLTLVSGEGSAFPRDGRRILFAVRYRIRRTSLEERQTGSSRVEIGRVPGRADAIESLGFVTGVGVLGLVMNGRSPLRMVRQSVTGSDMWMY